MKTKHRTILSACLLLTVVTSVAWKPGSTSWQEPVTTTVFDDDSNGGQLLMRSDDYNAGGEASYSSVNSVTSQIDSSGAWKLYLGSQSARTVWITPNEPINSSQPVGPPASYYWQNVEAYSQCYDQNLNQVPFENLVNGSSNCSLGVDFSSGGTKYKLVMSPHLPASGPATGLASVACNAASNNQCVNWSITPNTASANATVANLYYYNSRGALEFVGQYYNTFRVNATNP